LPTTSRLRSLYLSHLSKPASDRPIYRLVNRRRIRRIVELGVGLGGRAVRMIEAAAFHGPVGDVRYTGIDLFEDRTGSEGPGMPLKTAHRLLKATGARIQLVPMPLKTAHRLLKATGARIQLVPGDPFTALSRVANGLGGTELVIISAGYDPESLARAWFYLPRMLGEGSQVLVEQAQGPEGRVAVRAVREERIAELAATSSDRFRRAA
jgi:hypothetical protein